MRRYFIAISSGAALAFIASAPAVTFAEDFSQGKAAGTPAATGSEVAIDPLPCLAAIAADDDDTIISRCDSLIGNEKNTQPDRIRAALASAAAYDRKQQYDRAIADYDTALRLDPVQADAFNHRGEVRRKKGDRPQRSGGFRCGDQAQPGTLLGTGQLQIAGAGAGANRSANGGQHQARAELRGRQAAGREGDLWYLYLGDARPPDHRGQHPRGRGRKARAEALALPARTARFHRQRATSFSKRDYDLQRPCSERLDICWRSMNGGHAVGAP